MDKLYEVGMLCKHFKGNSLLDKNIYKILVVGASGQNIDESVITYTGEGDLKTATDLVVYENIFQGRIFAREYGDLVEQLPPEKASLSQQKLRVQPLSESELEIVMSPEFEVVRKLQEELKQPFKKKSDL